MDIHSLCPGKKRSVANIAGQGGVGVRCPGSDPSSHFGASHRPLKKDSRVHCSKVGQPQRGYTYRMMDPPNRMCNGVTPTLFPNFQNFSLWKNLFMKNFSHCSDIFLANCNWTHLLKEDCRGSTFIKTLWSFHNMLISLWATPSVSTCLQAFAPWEV